MSVGVSTSDHECRRLPSHGDFSMDLGEDQSQCFNGSPAPARCSPLTTQPPLELISPSPQSYWQLVATMMHLSSSPKRPATNAHNSLDGEFVQRLMEFLVAVAMAGKGVGTPSNAQQAGKIDECSKGRGDEEDIEERRRRHYCYYNYQMFGRRPPYSPLLHATFHRRNRRRRHSPLRPKNRTHSEGNSSSAPDDRGIFKVPKLIVRKTKSASPPTSPAEVKNVAPPLSPPMMNAAGPIPSPQTTEPASPLSAISPTTMHPLTPPQPPIPPRPAANRKSSSGRRSVHATVPSTGERLMKCGWMPCGKLLPCAGMHDHLLQHHFGRQRNEKGLVLCFWRDCWLSTKFFPSSEVASHISYHLPTLRSA